MRREPQLPSPARLRELHLQSRRRRIEALVVLVVLAGLLLYGAALLLLPRTADGVAGTRPPGAPVQDAAPPRANFTGPGTTVFVRAFNRPAAPPPPAAPPGQVPPLGPL